MKKRIVKKLLILGLGSVFTLVLVAAIALVAAYAYLSPQLPSVEVLKDVRLQVPLRVYSADGELIAEFGEMRRTPLAYEEVPEFMVRAVLAAEDDRFFTHPGVDYHGLLRAALNLITTGERSQGGSTITMQVARNFFLSREKTYLRKLNEIFLALKIESELSKEEILALYLNKIYLGNRAYGVAAAAQVYYGTAIENLSLAQLAMIAGLPKAPSAYNPIADPARAMLRRNYVLGRMRGLGYITEEQYREALAEPDLARLYGQAVVVEAPYVAEMVRAEMVARYGNEAYTNGYRVYTTVEGRLQQAANQALRTALLDYDRRHGFRGTEQRWDPVEWGEPQDWDRGLARIGSVGGLRPGVVVEVEDEGVYVYAGQGQVIHLPLEELSWAQPHIDENRRGPAPKSAHDLLQAGDIIRVQPNGENCWRFAQVPAVSGALVSLRPDDGAVQALVGGFDFFHSKFNRAVQAERQPGSSFKPFVYAAALDKGYTPASMINDAPVVFDDTELESAWRPENYSGRFYGPTRLREALTHSRNLVSIRLLRDIGIGYAVRYVQAFGFLPKDLPRDLSLALGSGSITPLELTAGYAVFANGGYRVMPYFIERIEGPDGEVLMRANPPRVCPECAEPVSAPPTPLLASVEADDAELEAGLAADEGTGVEQAPEQAPVVAAERVLDARTAYMMNSMMRDVVAEGTARAAMRLGRRDLAGKTGTTNDQYDAWFAGYNRRMVATAWVGFDTPRPLGAGETGGRAALPIWIEYMREALQDVPEERLEEPLGLVTVRIDPRTGELAGADTPDAIFEVFRAEHVPQPSHVRGEGATRGSSPSMIPEQLF